MTRQHWVAAIAGATMMATVVVVPTFGVDAYQPTPKVVHQLPAQPCLKGRGNCVIYPKSAQLSSGRIVASFEESLVAASGSADGQTLPIWVSDDSGDTWSHLADVAAPAYMSTDPAHAPFVSNWTNPYLYVLPQDIGALSAGTLLLASVVSGDDEFYLEQKATDPSWEPSNDGDRSHVAIALYASTDEGATWDIVDMVVEGGWQGGSAGAGGVNVASANTFGQIDPVWEPYLMVHEDQLVVYYSDENDYVGYDPVTGVPIEAADNDTGPDDGAQILVHKTWDGTGDWSDPVVDVAGDEWNFNGQTRIGGGRPGMTNVVPTTDGKWLLTFEFFGWGANVHFKMWDDPLRFFADGLPAGDEVSRADGSQTALRYAPGSNGLSWGGSPVVVALPDGRLVYNAAWSGDVWVNETGASDGIWTRYQTTMPGGYSRSLQYVAETGQVLILKSWFGDENVQFAHVDLGDSTGPYYALVNRETGQVIGTGGNVTDANIGNGDVPDVQLEEYDPANVDTQFWHVVTKGDGAATLLNKAGGRAAAIWTGNASDGQRIGQWVDDTDAGLWDVVDAGDGYIKLQSAQNSLLYLTGAAADAPLTLESATTLNTQQWKLYELGTTPDTTPDPGDPPPPPPGRDPNAWDYVPTPEVLYELPADQPCLKGRGNCAVYPKAAELPSGRVVASFENSLVAASGSADGQTLPIYVSDDHGVTWEHLSEVAAPAYLSADPDVAKYVSNWTNPYLYVLPEAVGDLAAGTLLLTSVVSGDDQFYLEHKAADPGWVPTNDGDRADMAIALYASADEGVTWALVDIVAEGGWQGGSAGATGYNVSAANATRQVDPVWEPHTYVYDGKLVVHYSDENDYAGYDPTTLVPIEAADNDNGPDDHAQVLVHKTWDGTTWSAPKIDVAGDTWNFGTQPRIGGGRPGMTTVSPTTDGKWLMTFEFFGGGANVRYKMADSPLEFGADGDGDGEEVSRGDGQQTMLRYRPGQQGLSWGGSPVLETLADGRIIFNAAGNGDVWVNQSGASDGEWTQLQTTIDSGYSRNLTYLEATGQVLILQSQWGGAFSNAVIRDVHVDVGDSAGPYYQLQHRLTGQVVGTGGRDTDARWNGYQPDVRLEDAGSFADVDTQYWHTVAKPDGGGITLLNKSAGRSASVWGGQAYDGAYVGQWVDDVDFGQFDLVPTSDGYVKLRSTQDENLFLTGDGVGAFLRLRPAADDGSQEFLLRQDWASDVSLTDVLARDTSGPERPGRANGADFDLLKVAVDRVLTLKPASPVGLLDTAEQPLTAFLPDDAAFRAGMADVLGHPVPNERAAAGMLVDEFTVDELEALLLDHVIVGATLTSEDLLAYDGGALTTARGTALSVRVGEDLISLLDGAGAVVAEIDLGRIDINLGHTQIAHIVDRAILVG